MGKIRMGGETTCWKKAEKYPGRMAAIRISEGVTVNERVTHN